MLGSSQVMKNLMQAKTLKSDSTDDLKAGKDFNCVCVYGHACTCARDKYQKDHLHAMWKIYWVRNR